MQNVLKNACKKNIFNASDCTIYAKNAVCRLRIKNWLWDAAQVRTGEESTEALSVTGKNIRRFLTTMA